MNNPLRSWVRRRLEAPRLLDLGAPAPGDVSRIEAAQGLHGIKTSSVGSLFGWFVAEKPVNRSGTAPLGHGGAP